MTDFVYFGRLGPIWGSMTSSVVRNFKISRVKYHHRITGPNYVLPENFSLECAFLEIFHIWGCLGDDGVINCPEFWYSPTTTCKNSFNHPIGILFLYHLQKTTCQYHFSFSCNRKFCVTPYIIFAYFGSWTSG